MIRRPLIFFGIAVAFAFLVWGVPALLNKNQESGIRNQELGNGNVAMQQSANAPIITDSQLPPINEITDINTTPVTQSRRFTQEEIDRLELGQLVKDFASRFGTYSNQNFARNIDEILSQATGEARVYLEDLQDRYQALSNEYVGVSSVAVSVFWEESGGDEVREARVSLRRTETRGNEDQVYNQDLALALTRTSDGWKVQTIQWGERY